MHYYTIPVHPFDENTYILYDEKSLEAAVIDPGGSVKDIENFISKKNLTLHYVILTHSHADHIGGLEALIKNHKVPTVISSKEKKLLSDPILNLTSRFNMKNPVIEDIIEVDDGDVLSLGDKKLKIIATPGHTIGSICILAENMLFSGDTLFASSIGRTDLPTGSYEMISKSLGKLLEIDDDTVVLPGHGNPTNMGQEKKFNPFLQGTDPYGQNYY